MSDLDEGMTPEQAVERDELHKAFRATLATAAGKRVLFWMLERCSIYRDPFSGDDNVTNYTLGRQAAGRDVIAMLDEVDARFYPTLLMDMAEIRAMDRAAAQALADKQEEEDE